MAAWLTRGGAGVTHGSRWETCLPSPGQCGERLSLKLPVDLSLLDRSLPISLSLFIYFIGV